MRFGLTGYMGEGVGAGKIIKDKAFFIIEH